MLTDEHKISLSEAAKRAPGNPHSSTLWRHCRKGLVVANGDRVYLEYLRFGKKILTSIEALERFSQQVAQADAKRFGAKHSLSPPTHTRPSANTRAKSSN